MGGILVPGNIACVAWEAGADESFLIGKVAVGMVSAENAALF
jgi:hypothetical protein